MTIPDSILGPWSHHYSGEASKQTHLSIRNALDNYKRWDKDTKYEVFLQGSYKNDTNLRRDSDVDIVVQLSTRVRPKVASLNGPQLKQNQSHKYSYDKWGSFRSHVLKALKAKYGTKAVTPGRKSLKLEKGGNPAAADVVVTLKFKTGIALYLPDEHRWTVSYPQQHYVRGRKKERATNNRYKRTIRIFKSARNTLVETKAISKATTSSYFIECLLYNVPNGLFKPSFGESYFGIVEYLKTANLKQFECQNGVQHLFGSSKDLWSLDDAQRFIQALGQLWER